MARTISYFLIALLTFLMGLALFSSYRLGVALLSEETDIRSSVQVVAVDPPELPVPLRLGIFAGVDGVTFSDDLTTFNLFDDYRDREEVLLKDFITYNRRPRSSSMALTERTNNGR